jgi:Zn-dependent protease
MVVLATADFGHALAHTVSARAAGAPVDEILISSGMPRTLYEDNDVPPQVHRTRALGGPIFSAIGLLTSTLLQSLAPRDTLAREVAGWSTAGHGLILGGSLLPLPMVDGGTILKWTLVEQGYAEPAAEALVARAAEAVAVGSFTAGAVAARRRRWLPALGFWALALVVLGGGVREVQADGR